MNTRFDKITTVIILLLMGVATAAMLYFIFGSDKRNAEDLAALGAQRDRELDLRERELDLCEQFGKSNVIPLPVNTDKVAKNAKTEEEEAGK